MVAYDQTQLDCVVSWPDGCPGDRGGDSRRVAAGQFGGRGADDDGGGSGGGAAEKRVVDDRTVAHVLNRMAFGPAPGDIERVRTMGIARYIEEQLQPRKIGDAAMQERLAKFGTLTMTSRELGERYATLEELRRELQLRQPGGAPPGRSRGSSRRYE